MKKLLTFLTLLTLFFTTAWADEVTYSIGTSSPGTWSTTLGGNNGTTIKERYITTNEGFTIKQFYPTNTNNQAVGAMNANYMGLLATDRLTISGTATITKIVYNFTYYQTTYSCDVGSLSGNTATGQNPNTLTWTGSATSITLTPASGTKQNRLASITITYTNGGTSPTLFDIIYGTPSNGTISGPESAAEGSQVTLSAEADPGYQFGSWTVKDASNNIIDVLNNIFTMPSSNVTVNATFTELPTYGITVTGGTANPTSAYEGQTVTLTPNIPSGQMVDWDATTVSPSTVVIDHSAYTFTMPGQAVTVGFAFKDTPVQTNRFERITSTDDLEKDARYLIVYQGQTPAVMGAVEDSYGESVTGTSNFSYTDGVIVLTSETDAEPLTLGGNSGAWTFELDGSLIGQNGNNSLALGGNNTTWAISFDQTNGNATISHSVNGTTYNIEYNNSASPKRFAGYAGTQADVYLYKETSSTTSNKLYLIGYGMNGKENWDLTTAPEMTQSNGVHSVDVYFDRAARGLFQFAKGLSDDDSNWNGLSGRLFPSTNGSNVSVDNYDMDGTVGLWFTDNSNMYSFELPAGLYTIKANLSEWKTYVTQKEVTMEIKPASATFTTTKDVTMESNLTQYGGKIYYTTDGSDPKTSETRIEYTGTITLNATTSIKAIAILNYIQSEVVEKTYTKAPAAPEISPASCTFNEPFTVTITAENGADIYYTLDGSNPTNESTQYTGPFTVSTTTTVKAIAYVGEAYSSVTTATYTYSNVQPSTGDFTLVKSANDIVAGREYIIINSDLDAAAGAVSSSKFSVTDDFTLSNNNETASAGSAVKVFTLEDAGNDLFYLKDVEGTYYTPSSSSTDISSSKNPIYVAYNGGYVLIKENSDASRSVGYNHQASTHVFGSYTGTTPTGNQRPIYLYYRETNSVQNPVFSPVPGIYNVDIDVTISCATDGATIYYTTDGTEPSATNGTEYTGEMVVSESTTFKAIAVKGENSSSVVTAEYTIQKSSDIETVELTYSEPFTAGIGYFTIDNVSGFSPVWSLDGNYGVKGTSYSPTTNPTNNAAISRLVSPIIDMTGAVQPELTFSHQINSYFTDPTTQCTVWIRETSNGTSGTWIQIPITFSDPVAAGGWTNDLADIDLTDVNGVSYADKKVQISFLYTNPTEGTGAGTWEIQNFVVADNSEYRMVNNIAEFLALENGTKAKFKNPVTVLYDYAQYSSSQYHEYIWVKDESGYMQFYMVPTLNSDENSGKDGKAAYYENGDIIPAGFVVTKNYYEYGKYVQAYTNDALNAGFEQATQKGLADPEHMDFDVLNSLSATNQANIDTWCNRYITLEKIKVASKSGKDFTFANENGTVNNCVGYNKYNGDGSLLKDGTTSADVKVPAAGDTYYNVTGIIQLWQGGWEFMPIEFTEWSAEEVTLRKLCADGVVNNEYTISNPLQVVYIDTKNKSVWVKDDTGQSIWKTAPESPNSENFEIEYADNTRSEQANYDQSNWCQLVFASADDIPSSFANTPIINGGKIYGKFTNKLNPTLENVTFVGENELILSASSSYDPNYYVAANFVGPQKGYFFMNPKPQEYAHVVWAYYDSETNTMNMSNLSNQNPNGFEGSFKIDMSMNSDPTIELVDFDDTGKGYENFQVIVRLKTSSKGAPTGSEYEVFPLDITNVVTSINEVLAGNGEVKSVKFYNVAGIESNVPFQGVNIVVTEYTDGSRTTTKMLKR